MTIKIGWALNVAERLATLQTASPQKLLVLGVLRGTIEQERLAHRLFAVHRLLGEWFAPGEDLMRFIADHAQDWSGEGATEIFDAAEANV
ncbi:MAG: GIY-YIG nuclease family protein [Deltaproteobacteria bacterium]|nr:MAG: GIY-YIG nuclease family protein [Deltaproteobacteria bacterium]